MAIARSPILQDRAVDDPDLEEWIRRSRSGDLTAFDELVERYYRTIYHLAYRMLRNREAAEDATQEIFVKAWRDLHRFRGASRFITWLHAVAAHHCLSLARRRSSESARYRALPDAETDGLEDLPGDFDPEAWHRSQILWEALLRLPEKLRLVILLRYYSDYSVQEIAALLHLPIRTIYSRLEIGRSRLERLLKEPEGFR
jgi:RNA polymerase sigma-70 factor (ECF subfamily)